MCKLTKNLPIQGVLDFQDSGSEKGRGKIQGGGGRGLKRPSELCFGTSEIEWSYIMYTSLSPDPIIKLLVSVIQRSNTI